MRPIDMAQKLWNSRINIMDILTLSIDITFHLKTLVDFIALS